MNELVNSMGECNWNTMQSIFDVDTLNANSRLKRPNQSLYDKLIWICNKSGSFSIKSDYE